MLDHLGEPIEPRWADDDIRPIVLTAEEWAARRVYTYDEVKGILCEACKLKLPSTLVCGDRFYHTINGNEMPCTAAQWIRNTKGGAR
jgi:hypothetical protein